MAQYCISPNKKKEFNERRRNNMDAWLRTNFVDSCKSFNQIIFEKIRIHNKESL